MRNGHFGASTPQNPAMGQQHPVHPTTGDPIDLEALTPEQKVELAQHLAARGESLPPQGPPPDAVASRPSRAKRGSGIVSADSLSAAGGGRSARKTSAEDGGLTAEAAPASIVAPAPVKPAPVQQPPAAVARPREDVAGTKPVAVTEKVVAAADPRAARAKDASTVTAAAAPAAEPVPEKKPRAPVAFAANIQTAQEAFDAYCGFPGMCVCYRRRPVSL